MRAVRCTHAGEVSVVDVEPADPSAGVRVRIASASICGSDLGMIQGGPMPLTLGHELAGYLDDGSPVAIEPIAPCGECDQCVRGSYHLCRLGQAAFIGGGLRDGGMADEVRVPERSIVPLPTGLAVGDACLSEPIAVGLHGLRLAGASAGERVAVVGGGSIGLCAVVAARAIGCSVGLVGRHPAQLAAGKALGTEDVSGEYEIVVEAAGTESAVAQCTELAGPGGALVSLGVHVETLAVPGIPAMMKELRIFPSFTYTGQDGGRDIEDAVAILAADRAIALNLITHRFPLEKAADAFRAATSRESGAIKVVLVPPRSR